MIYKLIKGKMSISNMQNAFYIPAHCTTINFFLYTYIWICIYCKYSKYYKSAIVPRIWLNKNSENNVLLWKRTRACINLNSIDRKQHFYIHYIRMPGRIAFLCVYSICFYSYIRKYISNWMPIMCTLVLWV